MIKANVKGYSVELEVEGETTQCFVEKAKGRATYTASLACLEMTGELENSREGVITVPDSAIEAISTWASANGY